MERVFKDILYKKHEDESCYCKDTINHLKACEMKYYGNKNVESVDEKKKCLYGTIRQKIIQWLISLQAHFLNNEETLEMAIRLFDYIYFKDLALGFGVHKTYVTRCGCGNPHSGILKLDELQIIGIACYFLSCKIWERFPPKLSKLLETTRDSYTEDDIKEKEKDLLRLLNFDFKIPLVSQYFDFYLLHDKSFPMSKIFILCTYFSNLTLTDTRFLNYLPSSIAAAIVTFSKMILCSFAKLNPKDCEDTYDKTMFELEGFKCIIQDLWTALNESLTRNNNNSLTIINKFRVQKRKFNQKQYFYLSQYIEHANFDLIRLQYLSLLRVILK